MQLYPLMRSVLTDARHSFPYVFTSNLSAASLLRDISCGPEVLAGRRYTESQLLPWAMANGSALVYTE